MKPQFGLKPLPAQPLGKADFKVKNVFTLPKLEELPDEFIVDLPKVTNQKNSDFCAATSLCSLVTLKTGKEYSFEYFFACAKEHSGEDVNSFGLDLRTVLKTAQKVGMIEKKDAPYSLDTHDPSFLRDIKNWPENLKEKAKSNRIGSYFSVIDEETDSFDDARRTMWAFKHRKSGVIFGTIFSWTLSQVEMDSYSLNGGGHAMFQIGWKRKNGEIKMFIQNSYGEEVGENGRHYFGREVINKFIEIYGAFLIDDLSKEDAQYYIENNIKLEDNWLIGLFKIFLKILVDMFKSVVQFMKDIIKIK